MNTKFENLLRKILENGVEVTMSLNSQGIIVYDLNVRAKSGMKISLNTNGEIVCEKRYKDVLLDLDSDLDLLWDYLLSEIKDCMCGRDYINPDWLSILLREGFLKGTVTTVKTYE